MLITGGTGTLGGASPATWRAPGAPAICCWRVGAAPTPRAPRSCGGS
ncbi:hypothetical protein SAZ11_56690 [Streptomyces sp. FXJ1.4098]|nr:hypothetical protein [Streptomyces sp. FXJ1.4098]